MRIILLSKDLKNEKHYVEKMHIFIILVIIIISLALLVVLLVDVIVLGQGLLVLLVLGHQVIEVGLGLSELHLVHALAGVPVEEGLPPEHGGELLRDPLEDLLDGGGVTDEGGGHGQTSGGNITYSNLINNRFLKRFFYGIRISNFSLP